MHDHIYMTDYGEFRIKGRMSCKIALEEARIPYRAIANPFNTGAPLFRYKAEEDYTPLVQRYFRKIKAHMKAQWEAEGVSKVDCV